MIRSHFGVIAIAALACAGGCSDDRKARVKSPARASDLMFRKLEIAISTFVRNFTVRSQGTPIRSAFANAEVPGLLRSRSC